MKSKTNKRLASIKLFTKREKQEGEEEGEEVESQKVTSKARIEKSRSFLDLSNSEKSDLATTKWLSLSLSLLFPILSYRF